MDPIHIILIVLFGVFILWITDEEDADGDEKPEYAFDSWFDYDLATHILSPADLVYILRTVENNYFRFRICNTIYQFIRIFFPACFQEEKPKKKRGRGRPKGSKNKKK